MIDASQIIPLVSALILGFGLSAACGLRVFLPVLGAAIAVRCGWLRPGDGWDWLGSTTAIGTLSVACGVEIVAAHFPAVDHFLDVIAAPLATAAGTLLMGVEIASQFGVSTADPLEQVTGTPGLSPLVLWTCALVAGGGVALTTHAATATGRGGSLLSTAGLANPIYALGETVGALGATVTAIAAPACCAAIALPIAALLAAVVIIRLRKRRSATLG